MSDKTQTESQTLNMDSFNPKKAELIALAEKHKAATEIEIIDKETYEQVHSAQIVLRDTRNDIKSQWLAIRESANKFIKQVTTAEKELLEIITPIEDILIAKKDAWKKKEEEEKERKRQEQEAMANNRLNQLASFWYIHDIFDLKIMEEEAFQTLLSEKKAAFETAESERKAREAAEERKTKRFTALMSIWLYMRPEMAAYFSNELWKIMISDEEVRDMEDWAFDEFIALSKKEIDAKREELAKEKAELDRLREKEAAAQKEADEKKRLADLEEAKKQSAKETEERLKKEADDKKKADDAAAEAEQARLAKEKKYRDFLDSIWYTPENKHEFTFIDTDAGRVFYKKVGTYEK